MIQSVINPYTTLPTKTVMSQLAYKNCIDKDKVDDTHHSALIHRCVHFIVEDKQSNIIYLWQIHASYSQSPPPLCFQ